MYVILETILYSLHRLSDNEDNAPFQIDLGVQAKQVHRLPEPLADGRTLWLLQPVLRASSELRLGEQPQPGLADVHPGVL